MIRPPHAAGDTVPPRPMASSSDRLAPGASTPGERGSGGEALEDLGSEALEVVDLPELDEQGRDERAQAIAIGLLLGAAGGLLIDALLSRLVF